MREILIAFTCSGLVHRDDVRDIKEHIKLSDEFKHRWGRSGLNYASEFCSSRKLHSSDSVNIFGTKFHFVSAGEIPLCRTVFIHLSLLGCLCLLFHVFKSTTAGACPLTLGGRQMQTSAAT